MALMAATHWTPATAQTLPPVNQGPMTLEGKVLALSPTELRRLSDLGNALRSTNRALQDRVLAAAEAAASSPDARFALAVYQLEIGRQRQDDALLVRALDVLIQQADSPPERIFTRLVMRGGIAFRGRDYGTAASLWARALELRPGDPIALNNLAQARAALGDARGAIDLIRRAIAARRAGTEAAPETWYRQWVSLAHNGGLNAERGAAAHALVAAYPSADNWRYAMVAYRQAPPPQGAAEVDLLRFMRVAGVLAEPEEFQRLAQLLLRSGQAREGRAVLEEGMARGVVAPGTSPTPEILREIDRAIERPSGSGDPLAAADARSGAQRFDEALPLYRAALQQAGVDHAVAKTRLAAALALAGRRAEAEAAFRALAESPDSGATGRWYADLAQFWLVWLAQSG